MLNRLKRSRLWRSIYRNDYPTTPRGRVLVVLNSLALHLHPVRVPSHAPRLTYTWGLGGLSIFMFVILAITGAFLMLYYVPSVEGAYHSVALLGTQVALGQFVRNLHRWSAHVMVILVSLHLIRVFYTGAYKPPRDFNWVLGVGLLVLTLALSFTGYLLPWDQLAYWAATVGAGMAAAAPFVGEALRNLLVGGAEVGQTTLIRWYALHVFILPLGVILLSALHFWRIRKDGGISGPEPAQQPERLHTWPHLVTIELISALVYLLALTVMSILVKAPLLDMANPDITPNPAKAPWYFAGLQELLLHMNPGLAGVLLPAAALLVVAAIPYFDSDKAGSGVWFSTVQGRSITLFAAIYAAFATTAAVMADEFITAGQGRHGLTTLLVGWGFPVWIASGVVPLLVVFLLTGILYRYVRKRWSANRREIVIALFTMYLVSYIALTVIGVAFRGPSMRLMWPWLI